MAPQNLWHTKNAHEVLQELATSERGLSQDEARRRLEESGANTLPESRPDSLVKIFFSQFQNPLIYTLVGASAIVFSIGESTDAIIILCVLFFNAVVGTIQEGKAQNTLLALKKYVETSATVLREEKEYIVKDTEVVPGDILVLDEGEKIPADARILFSQGLKLDEASLTGESEAINKIPDVLTWDTAPTPEQKNMVFKGTYIVSGNGRAVVVATGLDTVIGKIAKEIAVIDTEIPLKASIRSLSRRVLIAVASISVVLFTLGVAMGNSIETMFATVVSLSVSIIPEGLPIVMTLVLATGVWRMSKQHALVKKLQAVEALGQARVLAVDKTGTITKNELVVREVWVPGAAYSVTGVGYESVGVVSSQGHLVTIYEEPQLLFIGKLSALLARARVSFSEEDRRWRVAGDPTQAAMLVLGEKLGFFKDALIQKYSLVSEIPFDYKTKFHATLHRSIESSIITVIGAPEEILERSTHVYQENISRVLSMSEREEIHIKLTELSEKGLRVVAVAYQETSKNVLEVESLRSLSFVGFLGMQDTLRPEVSSAMERARNAGIKVVMITGDHAITARAIAREAGIFHEGDRILTGGEIDSYSSAELVAELDGVTVFARVTPGHKMRIIEAYKARGEVVAMTGDGVNDAPPLVAADLGVAMGNIGTEVAKEAADIVLLDDNFGSIIAAVEEGRNIYRTIKRVILYLFSTSLGEVLVISGALLIGLPLPILAAQIIWLNFVTDGFLDIALSMEPKESKLLSGAFQRSQKELVDKAMIRRMVGMAIPMMVGTLIIFSFYVENDIHKAWTMSLTVLAAFQWFNAWNCRSEYKSVFSINPFSNLFLLGATVLVIGLQFLAVYTPFLQGVLKTVPLEPHEWFVAIIVASSILVVEEIRKLLARRAF